ncbi:MAG TPA: DUF4239 domain-containing protein [Candidatus Baltobacteraceae bacterium]|nr:DUF4239 domain-containing protein [Candidatus Baltobacteraceae bacterium]
MTVVTTAVIAVAAALVAAGVHHLVQRRFGYDVLSRHNDVAGFMYSAIGVIFAVVLGFVVIVVWQQYDQVRSHVDHEAASIIDLYHAVDGFPPTLRARVESQLVDYAHLVIQREWPEMQRGELAVAAAPQLEVIAHEIQRFEPVGLAQQDAHQIALRDLRSAFDARRERIRANEPSVPRLLWFALYAGAAATLGFTYLFGVKNRIAQLLMTATLAALIAIMFVVIQALDRPFQGGSAIQPSGWKYFLDRAPHMNGSANQPTPNSR